MYFSRKSWRSYLGGFLLFLLAVTCFSLPAAIPMGFAATIILFSSGGIITGVFLGFIAFRAYKGYQEYLDTKNKKNQRSLLDDLFPQVEEQKKIVGSIAEDLLAERIRFEQLKKETKEIRKVKEKLKSELRAIRNSDNNSDFREQPTNNGANLDESSSLLKPLGVVETSYGKPLFQHLIDRGREPTVSDIEEINREANENLNFIEEGGAQLRKEQEEDLLERVQTLEKG